MGVSLEMWRARIGTFFRRPGLGKSSAVVCMGRSFVTGLLRLTLLLSLCLYVGADPVDGVELQLNVTIQSPTFEQDLRFGHLVHTPLSGTRVCIISTSDTRYPTTRLESWNIAGDESNEIGQMEYAMSRRLLMLSGDVELNPGPKQQQGSEKSREKLAGFQLQDAAHFDNLMQNAQDVWKRSVIIEGFNPTVTKDILELLFEDLDETGGGPIEQIEMEENGKATIVFKEAEVAERVLQRPQTVCTIRLAVRRPPEASCTIKASGLETHIQQNKLLELFFKNKDKSGGGPVTSLDVDEKEGTAFVTFFSAEDAQRVANKGQHSLGGCEFTTAIVPARSSDTGPRATDKVGTAEEEGCGKEEMKASDVSQYPSKRDQEDFPREKLNDTPVSTPLPGPELPQGLPASEAKGAEDAKDSSRQHAVDKQRAGKSRSAKSSPIPGSPGPATIGLISEEDKDMLTRCLPQLIKNIGIEDGMLLAHLRCRGAVTQQQEGIIKQKGDRHNQVEYLLDVLLRGDSNAVDKLIYSMRNTGQSNIADEWLRQPRQADNWGQIGHTGSSSATNFPSEADRNLLERCRAQMMGDLNLGDGNLLANLRARNVLADHEEVFIKGITENGKAVGQLIDLLLRKTPSALEGFLHALNHLGYSFVVNYLRQPSTSDDTHYVRGGSSTTELEDALRVNLGYKLAEWKTALEEGSSGQGKEPTYIDQPCTVQTKGGGETTVNRAIQLAEESVPGDRIVVYGEAGMGKTAFLKELARSWIERSNREVVDKFKYLFLLPCRLVGNISLLNTICDELKLVHKCSTSELEKSLNLNETKIIFLIDSFEQLRDDVAKADVSDINGLISGRLFKQSTVIVTSRPDSKLKQSECHKTAHLKDLPEKKVKEIITKQFGTGFNVLIPTKQESSKAADHYACLRKQPEVADQTARSKNKPAGLMAASPRGGAQRTFVPGRKEMIAESLKPELGSVSVTRPIAHSISEVDLAYTGKFQVSGVIVLGNILCVTHFENINLWLYDMSSGTTGVVPISKAANPIGLSLLNTREGLAVVGDSAGGGELHFLKISQDMSMKHLKTKCIHVSLAGIAVCSEYGRMLLGTNNSTMYVCNLEGDILDVIGVPDTMYKHIGSLCRLEQGYALLCIGNEWQGIIRLLTVGGVCTQTLFYGEGEKINGARYMTADREGRLIASGRFGDKLFFADTTSSPPKTSVIQLEQFDRPKCVYLDIGTNLLYVAVGNVGTRKIRVYKWHPSSEGDRDNSCQTDGHQ